MTPTEAIEAAAEAARGLAWMVRPDTFAEHASGGEWTKAKHLEHVGGLIADAVTNGNGRLVVNMPSGYGKSKFISQWTPAWFLNLYPARKVILSANTDKLAVEHGGEVRNIARDNPFLRFRLREDSKAKGLWHTQAGGGMFCKGVGGAITGFRAHLLLIDDPYDDWDDAWSSAKRGSVERWFDSTAYQRMEPGGTIVVLHHRFHPRDLSGYLVEHHADDWQHVTLPEIAEAGDALGRKPGELLWPERWGPDDVERFSNLPEPIRLAMRQQQPTAAGTGLAYPKFSAGNVDQNAKLVPDLPLCVSLDFNRNPGMNAIVGQCDTKADRFVVTHALHGQGWTVERIMDELAKLVDQLGGWKWPGLEVFGDATGGGPSMNDGHTSFVLIRQRCERLTKNVRIRVPASNPGIVNSLLTTNDAFLDAKGARHVFIHPRCEILLEDLRRVTLDDDGKIDKNESHLTHQSDCLRYWVDFLRPLGGRKPQPKGKIGAVGGATW